MQLVVMRAVVKLWFIDRNFKTQAFRDRMDRKLFEIEVFEKGGVKIIILFPSVKWPMKVFFFPF